MISTDYDLALVSTPLTRAEKVAVCPKADVKLQARITHDDEDSLIEAYIEVAYDFLSGPNGWLGRCCLLQETWEAYLPGPMANTHFELPMRPLKATSGIVDFESLSSGSYGAIDGDIYHTLPAGIFPRLSLVSGSVWPYTSVYHPRAYRVEFVAGFTPKVTPSGVPTPIVHGIRLLAAYWFRNRETSGEATPEIIYGLKALCGRYRIGPDHS
jgi:uncharacterized phiE125 gp8 family phage protein